MHGVRRSPNALRRKLYSWYNNIFFFFVYVDAWVKCDYNFERTNPESHRRNSYLVPRKKKKKKRKEQRGRQY